VQKLLENNKKGHEIPRVACKDAVGVGPADIFRRCSHGWRDNLARRVHQALGEPFEDLLDGLRVWLLQVCGGEVDANVCDASSNLFVVLQSLVSRPDSREREIYQSHEGIFFNGSRALILRDACSAHARIVRHGGDVLYAETVYSLYEATKRLL
jgi:hypothetical protein